MSLDIIIKFFGKVLLFVLLQIFIFNNIQLTPMGITSFIYVILLLIIPFETPGWLMILFAFVIGLSIDISQDTGGSHAAASVLIMFLRPSILKIISPRDGYELGTSPIFAHYGLSWFLKYSLLMVVIHHFTFIFLEVFSFDAFFYNFLRVILMSIFTTILILLSQFLIFKNN